MSTYPAALWTPPTRADGVDQVTAADYNTPAGEVAAIQAELGTAPKGSFASVKARIAAIEAATAQPLTPSTLHATYGDHFTGASLDAKWTRVTYAGGDETYQQGGGSYLSIAPRAAGAYYYQTAPAGDFTLVGKFVVHSATAVMFGLQILSSAGTGVGCSIYSGSSDGGMIGAVTSGVYASGVTYTSTSSASAGAGAAARIGIPQWLKLTKVGGAYSMAYSLNGALWSETASLTPSAFTVARIGFGGFLSQAARAAVDFFDVQ